MEKDWGDQFADAAVVAAYAHRPPIPPQLLATALDLIGEHPRVVLDAGAGTGAVTQAMAPHVERVDAVEPSSAMLTAGQDALRDIDNVAWIHATVEEAELRPPYGLVVCAGSLHWMNHDIVLPKFRDALAPGAFVAIVVQWEVDRDWTDELRPLLMRHSTNQDEHRYNLVGSLVANGLYGVVGSETTEPAPFHQSVDSYIESIHSRSGWSRDRMPRQSAVAMDDAIRDLLSRRFPDDTVELTIRGRITWGLPAPRDKIR